MRLPITLVQLLILSCVAWSSVRAQISAADLGIDDDEADQEPARIQNKTYAEEHTALQRRIFANYDRSARPVRNSSATIVVSIHLHLMHFSVQQKQQSLRAFGHMFAMWHDENAIWNPADFNNVRSTLASQWELWQPELKIANSISGVNQQFELSKRSHATLSSISSSLTKVEIYPTFWISVGCDFDFTDYPWDVQECSIRLYTSVNMLEVELKNYFDFSPSVMLSWGDDSQKRHISDWELLDASANVSYFRGRDYTDERPESPVEQSRTWTVIIYKLTLRRNTLQYWYTLALPGFASLLLNALSFLLVAMEPAVLLLVGNLFLQVVFLFDSLDVLPPATGSRPHIVTFSTLLFVSTAAALALHVAIRVLAVTSWMPPPAIVEYVTTAKRWLRTKLPFGDKKTTADDEVETAPTAESSKTETTIIIGDTLRTSCIVIYWLLVVTLSPLLLF